MTKLDLQKELLEKIKPGTKPSDLKKQRGNISKKTDEGYSSDEGKNFADKADNQKIDNSKKNNFADSEKKLLDQITSLKKQLQTYKDFKEADLKIKEKYKKEIEELKTSLNNLNNKITEYKENISKLQAKIAEQDKTISELKNPIEVKQKPKQELFTCYHCKNQQGINLLVLELPEGKLCQPCWTMLRKKTKETLKEQSPQISPKENQTFTCVVCEIEKHEVINYKKVDISYKTNLIKGKEYPVCSSCSPHIKEYNEHEDQEFSPGED